MNIASKFVITVVALIAAFISGCLVKDEINGNFETKPIIDKINISAEKIISDTQAAEETKGNWIVEAEVYRTKYSECYHYNNSCENGTYYRITLEQAEEAWLRPCQKCVLR